MVDRGHALTLGDLLGERAFALELLSGGPAAHARPVLGAHAVEVESPTRWLAEGWVMLTTGMRLRGRGDTQVSLIEELREARVAALGFGVGLAFKRVPPALLEAARARSFPVIAVPLETKFRDIIRFIDSSLVGADAQLFHRLTALQRFVADALSAPEPERAMVERLSRFLDVSVVVLDEVGQLEITAGDAPIEELRAAISSQQPGLLELEAQGWHAIGTPIPAAEPAAPRWLILASRRQGLISQLIKPAANATAPLLAATARLRDAVRDQERAMRAALLSEALDPAGSSDPLTLAARAATFGLDFAAPARVIVVREHRGPGVGGSDLGSIALALADRLDRCAAGHLVATRPQSVGALAQADQATLRTELKQLADAHPGAAIGVGRPVSGLREAPNSLRDAELAVHRASLEPGAQVLLFEDFDVATFLVGEVPPERLRPWVERINATLDANPALREALGAYFEHDLDVAAAAAALHLHPNSLRYRLGRIEHLLGVSLRKPSTITSLYIALIADVASKPE